MEIVNNLGVASRSQLDLMKGGYLTAYLPAVSPFLGWDHVVCIFRGLRLPQKDGPVFFLQQDLSSFFRKVGCKLILLPRGRG